MAIETTMLEKALPLDITIIGYRDWIHGEDAGINVRDLHIATQLANQPQVDNILFIGRPVSLAEQLLKRKRWKCRHGELLEADRGYRLYRIREFRNFYVLSLWVPDIISPIIRRRMWWNDIFQRTSVRSKISRAKKTIKMRDDVLYLFTPFALSTISGIPHKTLVFDVIDNLAKHVRIARREKIFCQHAYAKIAERGDIITCVSSGAQEMFKGAHGHVLLVRNGVDRSWVNLEPEYPSDLTQFEGKIVGFVGHLSRKLDTGFLVELAERLSNITFILLGPVFDRGVLATLKGIANIRYLGFKNFSELAKYYFHFDATTIFYAPDKENDGDPLKLYESLSLGTPVVSLPSRGVDRFPDVVKVEGSVESFAEALRSIMSLDRKLWRKRCRAALSNEDFWDEKVALISSAISGAHARKS